MNDEKDPVTPAGVSSMTGLWFEALSASIFESFTKSASDEPGDLLTPSGGLVEVKSGCRRWVLIARQFYSYNLFDTTFLFWRWRWRYRIKKESSNGVIRREYVNDKFHTRGELEKYLARSIVYGVVMPGTLVKKLLDSPDVEGVQLKTPRCWDWIQFRFSVIEQMIKIAPLRPKWEGVPKWSVNHHRLHRLKVKRRIVPIVPMYLIKEQEPPDDIPF